MTNQYFNELSEQQQAEYQKYAEEHWDSGLVRQSVTRWNALDNVERKPSWRMASASRRRSRNPFRWVSATRACSN